MRQKDIVEKFIVKESKFSAFPGGEGGPPWRWMRRSEKNTSKYLFMINNSNTMSKSCERTCSQKKSTYGIIF